ncbi:50S ribosomal protein L13 [Candidatus Woesearchaeota archaeon]|nr:50S ribosomal protein L13 [Candidatus Woesearchaeota archaeon]
MNIDGKNLIMGRLAAIVAKKALLGEQINIFNCDEIVITGEKSRIFSDFKRVKEMGTHSTGPHQPKESFRIAKKKIRGMLPYKQSKGSEALARIKCFNKVPEEFKDAKLETIENINVDNTLISKYVTLKEISKFLGGKDE